MARKLKLRLKNSKCHQAVVRLMPSVRLSPTFRQCFPKHQNQHPQQHQHQHQQVITHVSELARRVDYDQTRDMKYPRNG